MTRATLKCAAECCLMTAILALAGALLCGLAISVALTVQPPDAARVRIVGLDSPL